MYRRESGVFSDWKATEYFVSGAEYTMKNQKGRRIARSIYHYFSHFGWEFSVLGSPDTSEYGRDCSEKSLLNKLSDAYRRFVHATDNSYASNAVYSANDIVGQYLTILWAHRLMKAYYVPGLPDLPLRKMKDRLTTAIKARRVIEENYF